MKKIYKFSSLILCLVLLLSSFSTLALAEDGATNGQEVLLGDMDSNGTLETTDARIILRLCAGMEEPTEADLAKGDMDSDGLLTVEDVVLALKAISGIGDDGFELPEQNGENILSDSPDNEFIKLIASTYDLDPASLVAIYSIPDSGTNYVLEFKGSGVLGNKPPYTKSKSNLKKVYHIGIAPERKISYTNGKLLLGGEHYNCEAAEGYLVFTVVRDTIMDQYPDYFS